VKHKTVGGIIFFTDLVGHWDCCSGGLYLLLLV
jgi:hypothetical protein